MKSGKRALIKIATINQKGGVGKTTLTIQLAAEVSRQKGTWVCVADTDIQRSLGDWWRSRDSEQPVLVECRLDQVQRVIRVAEEQGVTHLFFDTAPRADPVGLAPLARLVDLVLIPTRPSAVDLRAISGTLRFLHEANAPAAVVLNACPPRNITGDASVVRQARRVLEEHGAMVAAISIGQRNALALPVVGGRTAVESEPQSKAAAEIARLWQWVSTNPLAARPNAEIQDQLESSAA